MRFQQCHKVNSLRKKSEFAKSAKKVKIIEDFKTNLNNV